MGNTIGFAANSYTASGGIKINYNAEPTPARFHKCQEPVRAILGPYGSGKSTACVMELFSRAMRQAPHNGIRSTKMVIIRQHYPELLTTTLKTVGQWIEEKTIPIIENGQQRIGYQFQLNRSKPIVGYLTLEMPDKTIVQSEWVFLALEDDSDSAKLRSLDASMGWINEASEITKLNFTTLFGRCGRFPAVKDGGCTFSGVILDSNPPPVDHWLHDTFELEKPPGHVIFHQPPGILELPRENPKDPIRYVANIGQDPKIPKAENLKWLPENYYMRQTYGASREFIRVYLMGHYGEILSGKPIYTEFRSELHASQREIEPIRGVPLQLGFDFGGQPTCVIAQTTNRGQLIILDELCSGLSEKQLEAMRDKDRYFLTMGVRNFALVHLKPYLNRVYPGMAVVCTGDPSGNQRAPTDEGTCHETLADCGFNLIFPTMNNTFVKRREAVESFIMRINGLLVSPKAYLVLKGFQGGYRWKFVNTPTGETQTYIAEKNIYSHCHDCVQYLAVLSASVGQGNGAPMPGYASRPQSREIEPSGYGGYI